MKESDLSKKIALKMRQRGAWAVKIAAGPRQGTGLPDIIGCYHGVFLGLEVKLPGKEKTVTVLQRARLDAIEAAGGTGVMVTSWEQVDRLLKSIDEAIEDASA